MAENERFGRQPIQIVEIDQDFCTRRYGDISTGCPAGDNMNLIKSTIDLDSAPSGVYWTIFPASIGGPGPDGVSDTFLVNLGNETPGSGLAKYRLVANPKSIAPISSDGIPTVYFSFLARTAGGTESGSVIRVEANVQDYGQIDPPNFSDVVFVKPFDGTYQAENLAGRPPLVVRSEPEGDGYYRFFFEFQPTVVRTEYELFITTLFERGIDETIETTMWSASFGKEYEYFATGLDPVYPTSGTACFNTRSTCQVPNFYDKGVQVLRFVEKTSEIPTDALYWPMVTGVSVTPAKLNPGGANSNARALGQRASLSVRFQDAPGNDRIVDPYVADRDYDPLERGTWWTKWRARNPYYMQRPLRLRSGYMVNGQVVDEITRDFVITGFSGPDSNGNVSIQGKDVLTLAEDEKAQAPVASRGKLSADLTAGATSATLTPAGIGDDEYPPTGFVRVGKEVMAFTRSGDNLTLTRGQFGTEAKEHDEDDSVQLCLRYVSQAPQDILYDLLLNYANIPAEYLDKAQWDAEALDFLPRLYSAIITEPNGVSKLISEMCQQMYFTIWWDERLGKVILKSVRLAQEDEVFELDDTKTLVKNSVSWKDLADELITQVWVYYGQLDPTEKLDQGSNYATIAITADPSAEGADKHNLRRIKTIFSRWIDATNASAAEDLGQRILNRYGNAPRQVTFRVDAKDRYLWLGDYIRLTNRLRVDQFGRAVPVNLQIFEAEEAALGSEFRFTAQEFIPALIGGDQVEDPNERVIPITSDLLNVNLRTLHDSLFGAPAGTENITFVIREGVTIGGDAAGGGVNVAAGARVTTGDFYPGGASARSPGFSDIGQLPVLQRRGIASPRSTAAGGTVPGTEGRPSTATDFRCDEIPISAALRTGTWPSGVNVSLIIEAGAAITGEGGSASSLPRAGSTTGGVVAGDGGDALLIESPITITNGGVIAAGGGGGAVEFYYDTDAGGFYQYYIAPGGGGAGFTFSRTKNCSLSDNRLSVPAPTIVAQPSAGAKTAGGQAGRVNFKDVFLRSQSRQGGAGGSLAAPGQNSATVFGGDGGLPGKAVRSGAASIEWVNKGDVRGDEVA